MMKSLFSRNFQCNGRLFLFPFALLHNTCWLITSCCALHTFFSFVNEFYCYCCCKSILLADIVEMRKWFLPHLFYFCMALRILWSIMCDLNKLSFILRLDISNNLNMEMVYAGQLNDSID